MSRYFYTLLGGLTHLFVHEGVHIVEIVSGVCNENPNLKPDLYRCRTIINRKGHLRR